MIVCGLLKLTQICAGLLSYFYIYGRVVIPITSLTPQPVRACPVLGHGFPVTYIMIFFVHGSLGMEVIVCFVDIGVIVDHRFLNFLFTTWLLHKNLKKNNGLVWFMVFNLYIVAVSLIGGGNWSTWRKHRLMVTSVNSCGLFYCIIIVKYFKVQRKIHKKYSETCGKSRMTVCINDDKKKWNNVSYGHWYPCFQLQ